MPIIPSLISAICILAAFASPATAAQKRSSRDGAIVLAGGCFWGVEAVFEHVTGVKSVVSGYAGGKAETAHYDQVSKGDTGHAEAVRVAYDPTIVSLRDILNIYFTAAHDPTQLNHQGPDHGTQYRSAIFYSDKEQRKAAQSAIADLDHKKIYKEAIVTTLELLTAFYPAEESHQNFAAAHPLHPYIVMHDAPKVARLKKEFPTLYVDAQP